MDYRKECESRLLEVSVGAHKLTEMMSSWSTKEEPASKEGGFDLEDSLATLRKLQQATRMMSRVRQDLRVSLDRGRGPEREAEAAAGFGFARSRRFEPNCIEELKAVIRESSSHGRTLGTDVGERASSSAHVAQPRRAKGPGLIARLMGLEAIPSEHEHGHGHGRLARLDPPPLGIEMLKARMLPLMEKKQEARRRAPRDVEGLVANNGVDDCTNTTSRASSFSSTSNRSSRTYAEAPPIVILRTPQPPDRRTTKGVRGEKVCDNAQMLSGKLEKKQVKRREIKPEAKPSQRQRQQRRISSGTRESDDVVQKSIPSPASQAKPISRATARSGKEVVLSRGANAPRSRPKSVTWASTEPAKAKKNQGTRPSRKAIDIILAATGNAMYKEAETINQSRPPPVDALPIHTNENSKHCSRGRRRKDSKIFCEIMVKASGGGRNSRSPSEAPKQLRSDEKTTIQIAAGAEDVKLLVRSSRSFINHAQELFRLDGSKTCTYQQKKGTVEVRAKNGKLLLGCARELVAHKSRQLEGSNHPLNRTALSRRPSPVVSVDELVEEVANEVEKLRVCREVGRGAISSDQDVVCALVEGDLGSKNVVLNATWDQGWMEWICLEEVDYVIGPLERLMLCGLIEELVLDFFTALASLSS